jgi:hypothetical protein
MGSLVAAFSLMILGLTIPAENVVATEVFNDHDHENTNKNGEHSNFNEVINIGGKDGEHEDEGCVENSNNDKRVCHDHSRDR